MDSPGSPSAPDETLPGKESQEENKEGLHQEMTQGEKEDERNQDVATEKEESRENNNDEPSSPSKRQDRQEEGSSVEFPSEQSSSSSSSDTPPTQPSLPGSFSRALPGGSEEPDITYASHIPFRSYASTGGVPLESIFADEGNAAQASPPARRKTSQASGKSAPSRIVSRGAGLVSGGQRPGEVTPSITSTSLSGTPPAEGQRQDQGVLERVGSTLVGGGGGGDPKRSTSMPFGERIDQDLADGGTRGGRALVSRQGQASRDEVSLYPLEPYVPFSRFIVPSLESPSCYPRTDYITTASGNRVGRGTLLFGSQNITLAGRSVVSQGVILRGDLISLRFGRYVYLDENVLVHPSSYRSKGQTLHVPLTVGDYVVIGSNTVIRAVAIGSCVSIGENCIVGNRCILKDYCKLLPGTVLAPDTVVPSFAVFGGKPGRMIGDVPEGEMMLLKLAAITKYNLFLPDDYDTQESPE